jgi:predicted phage terminase large subunit-like protein
MEALQAAASKSFALLLEALRHIDNPDFGWVIFRRTYPQIKNEGGLWDESGKLFPLIGGHGKEGTLEWDFPSGAKGKFAHMQYDKDKYSWQGSQIPYIGFDELTHFTESQFFYMLSRNRSTCGVKPYMRATCNPDADSWVKRFLAPWVSEKWPEGDKAASGEIRWFIRENGILRWLSPGETHEDMYSVTFIEADVYDNPKLLEKDPDYIKRLKALPLVEQERLLKKNWSIRYEGGTKFKRGWFPVVTEVPGDVEKVVRYWDFAATEEIPANSQRDGPDYTASVKMGKRKEGAFPRYVILHATWDRKSPGKVETLVKNTAQQDGKACKVFFEEEGGASGKSNTFTFKTKVLDGFSSEGIRSTGSKEVRAGPLSSQCEAGNVAILEGHWNDGFFDFLEPFPSAKVHDDVPDAASGAYTQLVEAKGGGVLIPTEPAPTPAQTWEEQAGAIDWY